VLPPVPPEPGLPEEHAAISAAGSSQLAHQRKRDKRSEVVILEAPHGEPPVTRLSMTKISLDERGAAAACRKSLAGGATAGR
jgi:hypothetical protein